MDILLCSLCYLLRHLIRPVSPPLPRSLQKQFITMVFTSRRIRLQRRRRAAAAAAFCRFSWNSLVVHMKLCGTFGVRHGDEFHLCAHFNRKLLPASRECVWLDDFILYSVHIFPLACLLCSVLSVSLLRVCCFQHSFREHTHTHVSSVVYIQ